MNRNTNFKEGDTIVFIRGKKSLTTFYQQIFAANIVLFLLMLTITFLPLFAEEPLPEAGGISLLAFILTLASGGSLLALINSRVDENGPAYQYYNYIKDSEFVGKDKEDILVMTEDEGIIRIKPSHIVWDKTIKKNERKELGENSSET